MNWKEDTHAPRPRLTSLHRWLTQSTPATGKSSRVEGNLRGRPVWALGLPSAATQSSSAPASKRGSEKAPLVSAEDAPFLPLSPVTRQKLGGPVLNCTGSEVMWMWSEASLALVRLVYLSKTKRLYCKTENLIEKTPHSLVHNVNMVLTYSKHLLNVSNFYKMEDLQEKIAHRVLCTMQT